MHPDQDHEYVFHCIESADLALNDLRYVVYAGSDQELIAQRGSDVRLQGLGTCLGQVAAHDHSDLRHLRTTEECSRLD